MKTNEIEGIKQEELIIQQPYFILFVQNQDRSTEFYNEVLGIEPRLFVPGMTEFELPGGTITGLMPEVGIRRLLDLPQMEEVGYATGIKSECYLLVNNAEAFLQRALDRGAELLSPVQARDWGHQAGYCRDLDGTILAFAQPIAGD